MKLAQARRLALALPEAAEAPHFDYTSFRVRGKIFATAPPDEKHLHVFVDDDAREQALELHQDFVEKLWWGKKVVGLRVQLAAAQPAVVKRLLENAWRRKAPKKMHA
ncbi:MAG TPA: MmcQ/YjbR family DNA-binding protein [Usitatibacter sp.]|nr:MmcQ/YjbR family DNA-binding protein [Usitatibacter sp.]